MVRLTLLLFVALLGASGRLAAQESVEMRGITSAVKLEAWDSIRSFRRGHIHRGRPCDGL
jgi:hypothetical protein